MLQSVLDSPIMSAEREVDMSHQGFEAAQEALDFIFAGKAVVTLTSSKSGKHFTYKIRQKTNENGSVTPFFVNYLYGPNNNWNGDWAYTGFILDDKRKDLISGKKGTGGSESFKALNWALWQLSLGRIPDTLTIQHNDTCGRCGLELTDPISVATGIGPVCRSK